jgi:hypothetical protein
MGLGETNYYVENFQILCYNYYCIDIDNFEKEKYRNFRENTPIIKNKELFQN